MAGWDPAAISARLNTYDDARSVLDIAASFLRDVKRDVDGLSVGAFFGDVTSGVKDTMSGTVADLYADLGELNGALIGHAPAEPIDQGTAAQIDLFLRQLADRQDRFADIKIAAARRDIGAEFLHALDHTLLGVVAVAGDQLKEAARQVGGASSALLGGAWPLLLVLAVVAALYLFVTLRRAA